MKRDKFTPAELRAAEQLGVDPADAREATKLVTTGSADMAAVARYNAALEKRARESRS